MFKHLNQSILYTINLCQIYIYTCMYIYIYSKYSRFSSCLLLYDLSIFKGSFNSYIQNILSRAYSSLFSFTLSYSHFYSYHFYTVRTFFKLYFHPCTHIYFNLGLTMKYITLLTFSLSSLYLNKPILPYISFFYCLRSWI